jgi:cell division protein FtsQ
MAAGHVKDPWRPASSRIVLRKPKGNRRAASRRRLPSAKHAIDCCGRALRRCAPALVGVAMAVAFGGAAKLSHHWVTTSPRFAVEAIEFHGNQIVPSDAITELLPIHLGDNMFAADTHSLERALTRNPWISSAEVHRELPRTIVVTVRERRAVALVDLGALYLVEASGLPFKRAALELGEGDGLPAITGIERLAFRSDPEATSQLIRAALTTIAQWGASSRRPALVEINFDTYRGLTVRTQAPSVSVHLGALDDARLPERMRTFETAWANLSPGEQARTESMYLDAGPGQATIAFAKN